MGPNSGLLATLASCFQGLAIHKIRAPGRRHPQIWLGPFDWAASSASSQRDAHAEVNALLQARGGLVARAMLVSDANAGATQSSSAPAPSGSISSTLRPVSAASCSTMVR